MDSIVIVAPCPYEAELAARLERIGPVIVQADGIFVVDDGNSRVYISRGHHVSSELAPEELQYFTSLMADPIFYLVDFSDMAFCRKVVEVIADDSRLLVDDDHGLVLPGPEFVRHLRAHKPIGRDTPRWGIVDMTLNAFPLSRTATAVAVPIPAAGCGPRTCDLPAVIELSDSTVAHDGADLLNGTDKPALLATEYVHALGVGLGYSDACARVKIRKHRGRGMPARE